MEIRIITEKIAHRIAIECVEMAKAEGVECGAVYVANHEDVNIWIARPFANEDDAMAWTKRQPAHRSYVNIYSADEVAMFQSDPNEFTKCEVST